MMNREKVIKGFTFCTTYGLLNGENCHGHTVDIEQCPYDGCKTGCVKTLAKDTLALLKEQEPMPMIEVEVEDDDLYAWSPEDIDYYCPKCEKEISYDYNFCPYCGQAVKSNGLD